MTQQPLMAMFHGQLRSLIYHAETVTRHAVTTSRETMDPGVAAVREFFGTIAVVSDCKPTYHVLQNCTIGQIDVTHCNVDVECCNDTSVSVLSCADTTKVFTAAAKAVVSATAGNAALQRAVTLNAAITPGQAYQDGITDYISTACVGATNINQTNRIPAFRSAGCNQAIIDMYNRADVTIQCVAGAIGNLLPPPVHGSGSVPPPTTAIRSLPRDISIGMGSFGVVCLVAIIVFVALKAKQ